MLDAAFVRVQSVLATEGQLLIWRALVMGAVGGIGRETASHPVVVLDTVFVRVQSALATVG